MKKSFAILALCGFALCASTGLAGAAEKNLDASATPSRVEESGLGASADSSAREMTGKTFAWEENLKENPAARSIVLQRQYGVPYGTTPLGVTSSELW